MNLFNLQDGDKYSLHQSFAVHAHTGSIRTVHARGKYLASGKFPIKFSHAITEFNFRICFFHLLLNLNAKQYESGGADDRIYVYDMKKRQEVQLLTMHNAMINHLRFTPDVTHLFSASSDGSTRLAATRVGSWICEGLWHGDKGIKHISIHPTGKLALTLGSNSYIT